MRRRLVLLLLCAAPSSLVHAFDREAGAERYILFPRSFEQGAVRYSLGVSWTFLPRAVVEEEIRQVPMFNAALRYELPAHFSLTAEFSTIYITNVLSAGVFWSYSRGALACAVADELSYWFGTATMSGFDTQAMGLVNRPSVSVGIDIDSYKVTAKTELLTVLSQHTYFGTASVARIKPEIAGIATTLSLEQDLWKSTNVAFAFRANYAKPNYQLWLAFSVQDRWLFYPELQVSYIF
jgi:hypothetical protein